MTGFCVVDWLEFLCECLVNLRPFPRCPPPAAPEASRADEKEPGGPAQRAGGETPPARGGEGQLGGPAEDSGTAETRRLQVNTPPTTQDQ